MAAATDERRTRVSLMTLLRREENGDPDACVVPIGAGRVDGHGLLPLGKVALSGPASMDVSRSAGSTKG
jgi:hypothetical protein